MGGGFLGAAWAWLHGLCDAGVLQVCDGVVCGEKL